jgi:predicted nucleic acid-binding protein
LTRCLRTLIEQLGRECDRGAFQWLPFSHVVVSELHKTYASLGRSVQLRAGDAVHLACAAENRFTETNSNDQHLLAAAPHFGLRGPNVI